MLETPQERVRLLRKGISGSTVEKLYIEGNNFKIVPALIDIELVEIEDTGTCQVCETGIGYNSNGELAA